ncbi:DUF6090 family protein [Robiginitalea sp. IMCC44478]|uniref:DUF6090 family protein n=1 Tax=Robiginitalea sp. IMCC44478 TaxID=3459122 RepID=UPI0040428318
MLRFFRQIRQRLLTDNKFSKYLLYAIGEILLVVIGILIALQIDNWNENRQKAKEEHEILKQIEQDLVESRTQFADLKHLNELLLKSGRFILEHLDSKAPITDSLLYYIQLTLVQEDFNPVDTGYTAMLNSGSSELKNDSLRVQLSYYFEDILKMVKIRNDKLLAIQWDHLEPFMLTHFKVEKIESEESEYYDQMVTVPRDYNELTFDDTYANILHLKNGRLELNILRLTQTQESLEQLIEEVRTEINQTKEPLSKRLW